MTPTPGRLNSPRASHPVRPEGRAPVQVLPQGAGGPASLSAGHQNESREDVAPNATRTSLSLLPVPSPGCRRLPPPIHTHPRLGVPAPGESEPPAWGRGLGPQLRALGTGRGRSSESRPRARVPASRCRKGREPRPHPGACPHPPALSPQPGGGPPPPPPHWAARCPRHAPHPESPSPSVVRDIVTHPTR